MNLILLGPPGTGKGTQAKLLANRLNAVHIATGDLFRDAVKQGTELGLRAKEYMDRGDLVPDEVTISMLLERIEQPDAQGGAIFDGFPRTLQQAQALDEALAAKSKEAAAALHITAPDDEIVRRLSGRLLCPSCGAIYHEQTRPPTQDKTCDKCGSELHQREDDKPEVVRARLEKQRPPAEMLDYYRKQGKLVDIDGARAPEEVTKDLLAAIERATAGVSN
ncbi:MAG: adenylate kinase [Chloroflexi bacterium]|nr:adenylate kinase [Chloroflexota bacterium]MCI0855763.1 adenylate kinase [Chloroflexota bacterium]